MVICGEGGNDSIQNNQMTFLNNNPNNLISNSAYEALIDQLRACTTSTEILEFENWFNSKAKTASLHELICDLLRERAISR